MVAEPWQKSSYSNSVGESCVEARMSSTMDVDLRDSKNPARPHLRFSVREWRAFLGEIATL